MKISQETVWAVLACYFGFTESNETHTKALF
jgi:hypothetical protein